MRSFSLSAEQLADGCGGSEEYVFNSWLFGLSPSTSICGLSSEQDQQLTWVMGGF